MIFDNGKRADQICLISPEKDNDYEIDIHTAAVTLNDAGYYDSVYLTHYSSGNTIWTVPGVPCKATVRKSTGNIEFK